MKRRNFLKSIGFSFAYYGMTGCQLSKNERPNIVLILVDDMGWTDPACFGSKYHETPNIDRLCSEGMKFTRAYAACAVCSPTRASVMTGKYPARTGITDWIHHADPRAVEAIQSGKNLSGFDPPRNRKLLTPVNNFWLEHDEITIPELLKPQEYVSCHVGKWHLGPPGWYPDQQGFDYNFGGCQFGQPPGYFDPYANKRYKDIPTLLPREKGEYLTDREADEAVNFIHKNKDQPFFLYMAHYAVHSPLQAPQKMIDKYEKKEKTNQKVPVYAAMMESVDQAVGKIIKTIGELNLTGKTMILFTSDNGGASHFPATDNTPLRKGKGFPYEGGIRVPLIFSWPGVVNPGSVCHEPVISMDFLPTICEAAQIEQPKDREIDGLSLMPLLKQSGTLDRQTLYWHFPHYWWGTNVQPYSIIRDGEWKLIRYYQTGKSELFNLTDDLSETKNLAGQMPEKVKELNDKLSVWLTKTGAKMPEKNPNHINKK